MPRGIPNPPAAETISGAAAMFLRMSRKQFNGFQARTTAEAAARNLIIQSLRGDISAFDKLYELADRVELIEDTVANIDGLSRSLMELAERMNADITPETGA